MKTRTRRCFPMFAFYDRTGIQKYLEKQAANGWMLTKIATFGWIFKKCEPTNIQYSVTYFPKASAFDPEPSEDQLRFREFCEHAGWKLAASNAQMQIFVNEQPDPIPIETDPVMELEQIHASAKKSFLPGYFMLLFCSLLQIGLLVWRFCENPLSILSSNANLFTGGSWSLLLLVNLTELIKYALWYHRATRVAREEGEFLATRGGYGMQLTAIIIMMIAFVLLLLSFGGGRMVGIALLSVGAMLVTVAVIVGLIAMMKRLKFSARVNRTVTIVATLVLSVALSAGILFGVIGWMNLHGTLEEKEEAETYIHNGVPRRVWHDPLPLTIEDLIESDYDGYSYEMRQNDRSILVEIQEFTQRPRLDALAEPSLSYSVTTIRMPVLYDVVKKARLSDFAHNYGIPADDTMWKSHRSVNPDPWGAIEVYQLYLGGKAQMRFLLCYEKVIAEVDMEEDWQLTEEQMKTITQKLSK